MGVDRSAFDPLDLEIIDRVYEAACVALIARYPIDDETKQSERRNSLRRRLFALAEPGSVEFDSLYEKVLSSYDPPKVTPLMGNTRSL